MTCDHDWSVPVGTLGKGLKNHPPPELWTELEATYAAGIEDESASDPSQGR